MTEFVNWATLCTYGGALAMVVVLTQFTKDLSFTKKIPTRFLSYGFALMVLLVAHAFTGGLSINVIAQALFNAVIVSIAANGGFEAVNNILEKDTDGRLLIDTSDPEKDIFRLDLETLDGLSDKKTITLKVKPDSNLSA